AAAAKPVRTDREGSHRPAARRCTGRPAAGEAAPHPGAGCRAARGAHPGRCDEDDGPEPAELGRGRRFPRTPDRALRGARLGAARTAPQPPGLMLEDKIVAVVVPAYDEEELVGNTIRGLPAFVDRIFVVDDASRDGTAEAARDTGD